jgi:hypothetical protein
LQPGPRAYDGKSPARYDPTEQKAGWYGIKTLWVVKPRFRETPILVRGGGMAGGGRLRFAIEGWGGLAKTASLPDGTSIGAELHLEGGFGSEPGWRHYPTTTFFRRAGCYAFQVDGRDFSSVIVFEVAPIH